MRMVYNRDMKRCVCLLLCMMFLASFCLAVPTALADGEACYVVPEGQQIGFIYREFDSATLTNNNVTIVLPVGYTVTVQGTIDMSSPYVSVMYAGLSGYVSNTDFAKLQLSAAQKDLPQIEVKPLDGMPVYRIVAGGRVEADLAADATLVYRGTYVLNNVDYYAVQATGNTNYVYYVLQNSVQNSIEIEDTLHPRANVVPAQEAGGSAVDDKKHKDFTWVRFVLILGIIVPFITIILMIIRPKSRARRVYREVSDSDDDYDGIDEV